MHKATLESVERSRSIISSRGPLGEKGCCAGERTAFQKSSSIHGSPDFYGRRKLLCQNKRERANAKFRVESQLACR
jgi:hypothetical protein